MLTLIARPFKWIENLRISHKIVFAFAAVLACAIGLGAFSIDRLERVDAAAEEMRSHWLPQTRSLGELSFQVQRFRVIEAAYVMAPPVGKAAEAKTLASIRERIDKALQTEVSLAQSGAEQAALAAIAKLWREYFEFDRKFIELAQTQGDGAATALYRNAMREAIHDFQDKLAAEVAENVASAGAAADRGAATGAAAFRGILAMMAVATVLCLGIGFSLWRGISRPIAGLTHAMTTLARGDMSVFIPALELTNEIGEMARSAAVFKDDSLSRRQRLEAEANAQRAAADAERERAAAERARASEALAEAMRNLGAALKRLAGGDLSLRLDVGFSAEYAGIRDDFNEAVDKLKETLLAVVSCASAIQLGTSEISKASDDLSQRTEQQASRLEETSTALVQITENIKKSADAAAHARQIVATADDHSKTSAAVVRQAVSAMDAIAQSADHISQIIGVIDEIAFQTNLLALNAGVEAARAGEAGRGFAVVASEVRALALRSADAAKEIKGLITASGVQVQAGVKLVGDTGAALEQISGEVSRINEIVDEIARGAREQATGVDEVNSAIDAMERVTQQNAAMVEQSTAATQTLAEETSRLAALVAQFQVERAGSEERLRRELKTAAPHAFRKPARAPAPAAKDEVRAPALVRVAAGGRRPVAQDDWTEF